VVRRVLRSPDRGRQRSAMGLPEDQVSGTQQFGSGAAWWVLAGRRRLAAV